MSNGFAKLICALFACLTLSSCGGGSGSDSGKNNDTPPPATALGDIPALMDYYKVPGVSIALIKDFQIERLLVYGVRNKTTGELVTVQTPFQAGSISKSVAAVAALRLAQDGRLFLDEDINNALTSWKLPDNSFTAIQKATPRMLLNHTAGTTVHGFDGYLNTDPLPSLIQVLNGVPPANSPPVVVEQTPGQSFMYSGGGYVVLQQALIDVTGMPFADLLKETVLDPLAMTDSTYQQPLPAEKLSLASAGHDSNGSVIKGTRHIYPELAAAGLWTTPKDLALFLIELQQSLQGRSNQVLNTAMTQEMMTPPANSTYGLGIDLHTAGAEQYFWHNGVNAGFQLFMVAHKDKGLGAVVMTNGDNGGLLISRIMTIIPSVESWPAY